MNVMLAVGFGLVSSAILAVGAAGFTIQFGVANIFNLSYGAVMAVGMYIAYLMTVSAGWSIWLSLVGAAVGGAVLSWVLNACLFSPLGRRGVSLWAVTIVTFAVGIVVDSVLLAFAGPLFRTLRVPDYRAVHVLGMVLSTTQIETIGLVLALMAALHVTLRYSRLGKRMRATAANPGLARTSGIATSRVTGAAWLLSGGFCGIAGVLEAVDTTTFTTLSGQSVLLVVAAAAIFGGIGQPYGAMLGALVIGMATELSALISPSLRDVVAFGILAATLLVRPNGLIPSPTALRGEVQ